VISEHLLTKKEAGITKNLRKNKGKKNVLCASNFKTVLLKNQQKRLGVKKYLVPFIEQ